MRAAALLDIPAIAGAPITRQLARYVVGGAACAVIYSAVFAGLTAQALTGRWAVLAVLPSFLVAATCGLFIHGRWSFRGGGERLAPGTRAARFFIVQFAGLLAAAASTWVVTGLLAGPAWASIAPSVMLTPIATFLAQRRWVFAA